MGLGLGLEGEEHFDAVERRLEFDVRGVGRVARPLRRLGAHVVVGERERDDIAEHAHHEEDPEGGARSKLE